MCRFLLLSVRVAAILLLCMALAGCGDEGETITDVVDQAPAAVEEGEDVAQGPEFGAALDEARPYVRQNCETAGSPTGDAGTDARDPAVVPALT